MIPRNPPSYEISLPYLSSQSCPRWRIMAEGCSPTRKHGHHETFLVSRPVKTRGQRCLCKHYTQPTHASHARTRDCFSRGSRLMSSSQVWCVSHKNSHSSHLAQHVARALVVVSFTIEHHLTFDLHSRPTFYSTINQTLTDVIFARRFLSWADPPKMSFGPLAETHSPTGYKPKDLTEEDASKLVKPMFFHRPA